MKTKVYIMELRKNITDINKFHNASMNCGGSRFGTNEKMICLMENFLDIQTSKQEVYISNIGSYKSIGDYYFDRNGVIIKFVHINERGYTYEAEFIRKFFVIKPLFSMSAKQYSI